MLLYIFRPHPTYGLKRALLRFTALNTLSAALEFTITELYCTQQLTADVICRHIMGPMGL